ncbi:hypothetical protein QR685DRAFT_513352 [Neurospora intermedia]|uniref:Secreted protein n=1 Tax=Neurospora intermedia TaxID=5142 RepID=A0ABR3DUV5_NEUIN
MVLVPLTTALLPSVALVFVSFLFRSQLFCLSHQSTLSSSSFPSYYLGRSRLTGGLLYSVLWTERSGKSSAEKGFVEKMDGTWMGKF